MAPSRRRHARGGGDKCKKSLARDENPIHPRFVDHEEPVECTIIENIDACIIGLFEKRASTREAAMVCLIRALEGFKVVEDVRCKYETIVSRCIFSLKKGSIKEACLAYRALGILALNVGGGNGGDATMGSKHILAEAFPYLSKTVEASSDMRRVLPALDSLAAATFTGEIRDEEIERSMDTIWDSVIEPTSGYSEPARKTTPQVLAAAVSAWAFLLTVVHDRYEAEPGESCKDKIAVLTELLYNDDRTVRMAAGEALAACIELKLAHDTSLKDMAAISTTVSDLAIESTGNGADDKRKLTDQRNVFVQIEEFLRTGKCPMKWVRPASNRQHVLTVSTWTKLLQLNFLARFLGNGFERHLLENPLFEENFEIVNDEVEGLLVGRNRLLTDRKMRQKARTLELKKRRADVWEEKNKFGLPEKEPESDTMALVLLPTPPSQLVYQARRNRERLLPPATTRHMLPPPPPPIL